ncbi:hypothetical protein FQZ97_1045960 [compost metagenome]
MQPLHQRALGGHGLQAGQQAGVGALAGHLADEVDQHGRDRNGGEFERPLQHRDVGIESLGREQRAARRAGHAHHAFDADAPPLEGRGQVAQRLVLFLVRRVLEGRERTGIQIGLGTQAGQHLGHQSTA